MDPAKNLPLPLSPPRGPTAEEWARLSKEEQDRLEEDRASGLAAD